MLSRPYGRWYQQHRRALAQNTGKLGKVAWPVCCVHTQEKQIYSFLLPPRKPPKVLPKKSCKQGDAQVQRLRAPRACQGQPQIAAAAAVHSHTKQCMPPTMRYQEARVC